jgi:biotin operon repressor
MEKLSTISRFQEHQNLVLAGFDPVSAGGFTQVPNCVLGDKRLSLSAKVIYAKLLSYAWTNDYVYPGQEKMAQELGAGKRTVIRAVAELEKVGYLEVKRRGQGLTNVYTLHHTVKYKGKK